MKVRILEQDNEYWVQYRRWGIWWNCRDTYLDIKIFYSLTSAEKFAKRLTRFSDPRVVWESE